MAFEALLEKPDQKPRRWRQVMIAVSLLIHGVALAFGVVKSVWSVAEMPLPAIQVTLAEAPPPPPPPPPPAGGKKSSSKPRNPKPSTPKEIVQPKETPKEEAKKEPEEEEDHGQVGGVVGGVEGGVVGGVVGGVGEAKPPPPKDTGPKLVAAAIGTRQLLVNPGVPPYCCPKIPKALERADSLTAHLRVCVTAQGAVYDVRVVSGAGPAIDSQIPGFVRRWRYRPMTVDGEPKPFCYPVTYQISQR